MKTQLLFVLLVFLLVVCFVECNHDQIKKTNKYQQKTEYNSKQKQNSLQKQHIKKSSNDDEVGGYDPNNGIATINFKNTKININF